MKTYKLTQDNGGSNPGLHSSRKYTVSIDEKALTHHLRRHFRWRKDVTYERLMKAGSRSWDRFIFYLWKNGF